MACGSNTDVATGARYGEGTTLVEGSSVAIDWDGGTEGVLCGEGTLLQGNVCVADPTLLTGNGSDKWLIDHLADSGAVLVPAYQRPDRWRRFCAILISMRQPGRRTFWTGW